MYPEQSIKYKSFDTLLGNNVDRTLEAPLNFDRQHSTVALMTHFDGLILMTDAKLRKTEVLKTALSRIMYFTTASKGKIHWFWYALNSEPKIHRT